MQPSQIAVIWTMYEELQRSEAASKRTTVAPRSSFRKRFGAQVRHFAYRTQLGPVIGHPA